MYKSIFGVIVLLIIMIYLLINIKSSLKDSSSKNKMFYLRALIIVGTGIILMIYEFLK